MNHENLVALVDLLSDSGFSTRCGGFPQRIKLTFLDVYQRLKSVGDVLVQS